MKIASRAKSFILAYLWILMTDDTIIGDNLRIFGLPDKNFPFKIAKKKNITKNENEIPTKRASKWSANGGIEDFKMKNVVKMTEIKAKMDETTKPSLCILISYSISQG